MKTILLGIISTLFCVMCNQSVNASEVQYGYLCGEQCVAMHVADYDNSVVPVCDVCFCEGFALR